MNASKPVSVALSSIAVFIRWMLAVVSGLLFYGMAKSCALAASMGMPFPDWQWYLAWTGMLLLCVIVFVLWIRRGKMVCVYASLLLVWLVVGYWGFGAGEVLRPSEYHTPRVAFWTGTDIFDSTEEELTQLESGQAGIYLSVAPEQYAGPAEEAFVEGLRRLEQYHINVRVNVRASDYLSVPVADEWIENIEVLSRIINRSDLSNIDGILGDAEPPVHSPLDPMQRQRSNRAKALETLRAALVRLRSEYPGIHYGVTTYLLFQSDHLDGDDDLSVVLRSAVSGPVDWDFVNTMVYSSYFPESWQPWLIHQVTKSIAQASPNSETSCLIGLAVRGAPDEPELTYDALLRDALVCRAAGIDEIVVYKLSKKAREKFGTTFAERFISDVRSAPQSESIDIPFSRGASVMVFSALLFDSLCDCQGKGMIPVIIWVLFAGLFVWKRRPGHSSLTSQPSFRQRGQ